MLDLRFSQLWLWKVFWIVARCNSKRKTDVSEEHTASIFRIENWARQESSKKASGMRKIRFAIGSYSLSPSPVTDNGHPSAGSPTLLFRFRLAYITPDSPSSACRLLSCMGFDPEEASCMFFRNVGLFPNYSALVPEDRTTTVVTSNTSLRLIF
jgi:hypothetical protein